MEKRFTNNDEFKVALRIFLIKKIFFFREIRKLPKESPKEMYSRVFHLKIIVKYFDFE